MIEWLESVRGQLTPLLAVARKTEPLGYEQFSTLDGKGKKSAPLLKDFGPYSTGNAKTVSNSFFAPSPLFSRPHDGPS